MRGWWLLRCTTVGSEAEGFSSMAKQRSKRRPIEARSTAIAWAMASIRNDERASFGVMSGHDRKILSLSAFAGDPATHPPGAMTQCPATRHHLCS